MISLILVHWIAIYQVDSISTVWTSTGAWSYLKCKKDMVYLGGGHDIKFWEIICYLTIPVWGSIGVLMPGLARARSSSDSGLNTNTNASACRYKMAHIFIINWLIFATTHTQTKNNWKYGSIFYRVLIKC